MPAKSDKQRRAAAAALAAKSGQITPRKLRGAAREMYEGMTKQQLTHFVKEKIRKGT